MTGLSGGSVTSSGGAGTYTGFQSVLQGSLIGQGADGSTLRIPVPDTGGTDDAVFNTAALITQFVPGDATFNATDLAPGSGLFRFTLGDEVFDSTTGDLIGGSSSSLFGDIEGVGFTNPAEEFTYVEFVDATTFEPNTGFAVFGNPTEGQARFAEGDFALAALDPNGFIDTSELTESQIEQLTTGQANTVEGFVVQPNQFLHAVREDGHPEGQTPFFMIGNEGFSRFGDRERSASVENLEAQPVRSSGKWLYGSLYIGDGGEDGTQESSFSLAADDIRSYEGSGPLAAATTFETAFSTEDDPELGDGLPTITFGSRGLGTFEDADGNSIFGESDRYMVLSNLTRQGVNNEDSVPPDFSTQSGETTFLTRVSGDPARDGTTNILFEGTEQNGDYNALLARDEDLTETISNPLPLAGARLETYYDTPLAKQVDVLDSGFAAGLAVCEGGDCGDTFSYSRSSTGFDSGISEQTGVYSVRTGSNYDDEFRLTFGGHTLIDPEGAATPVNFDTSNEVQAVFTVTTSGAGDVPNTSYEGIDQATFRFEGGGTTSAYIDDNRFGVIGQDGTDTLEGFDYINGPVSTPITSSFALASSGLLGTSGLEFPAGTDTEHEFVRWGYWGSTIEVPQFDTSRTRTDVVHLGTWVAGVGYDFRSDHIPFDGVAEFGGLAVGTMTDLATLDRSVVGGNFNMSFNFGTGQGMINLNIPAASLNENVQVFGYGDMFSGNLANAATDTVTGVNGGFFTNPNARDFLGSGKNDGIAATGGTFDSVNTARRTHTVGIFAGDRTRYTPALTVDTGTGLGGGRPMGLPNPNTPDTAGLVPSLINTARIDN